MLKEFFKAIMQPKSLVFFFKWWDRLMNAGADSIETLTISLSFYQLQSLQLI